MSTRYEDLKTGQSVRLVERITVTITLTKLDNGSVEIGVQAPKEIRISRGEGKR